MSKQSMAIQSICPELKKYITLYLSDSNPEFKDLTKSQIYIKQYRNRQFDNFSLKDSRILHMSTLLYRFKDDLDVGEIFWKITRAMILSVLTNDQITKQSITNYLKHFEVWKNDDLEKLIFEIATVYYNILEIKTSIEMNMETNNNNITEFDSATYSKTESNSATYSKTEFDSATYSKTEPNTNLFYLNQTLQNIEEQCTKINIFEKVLNATKAIIDAKTEVVGSIVIKAYWDKIEEDIQNHFYDVVFANLTELKNNMKQVLPKSEYNKTNYLLDECFDIFYFKQLIEHKVFDKSNVLNLLNIIILFLKEWDSPGARQLYDDEQIKIINMIDNMQYQKAFRTVLEYGAELVSNFLLRKEAWSKLLSFA